jgi:ATP-binding cassette, sub-family E, member 1
MSASLSSLNFLISSYVICVEHDLSVLDYLSDFICVLYGLPSAYGVVTLPFSVREGINIFLDGKVPTENLRFRDESLTFKLAETAEEALIDKHRRFKYPKMSKQLGEFHLEIEEGGFTDSEIIVMLGENGTGKVGDDTLTFSIFSCGFTETYCFIFYFGI